MTELAKKKKKREERKALSRIGEGAWGEKKKDNKEEPKENMRKR